MNEKCDKPSIYTILYWLIEDKKIDSNDFFHFLKFFWPDFKKKGDYVFLEQNYTENEFNRMIKEDRDPEYWINLITVNDYFSDCSDDDEEKKSTLLIKSLVELWSTKLKKDFPNIEFIVHYFLDKEHGDFGLTFYQNKSGEIQKSIKKSKKITTPNMKENKLEQSSNGPRPGIPRIREPRPDEVPASFLKKSRRAWNSQNS